MALAEYILLFIRNGQVYRNYWFKTGSSSFLLKLLKRRQTFLPALEGIEASEEILDSFDIDRIDPVALIIISPTLFSSGVATPLQNMVLRPQTHMGRPALGGFVIKADPVTLLFQTGYLTINQARQTFDQWLFALRIPNQEVR